MPRKNFLGQRFDDIRVSEGDITTFATVAFKVVEFRLTPIVFAKQFPFAFPDGEVGQIGDAVKGVAIRGAAET